VKIAYDSEQRPTVAEFLEFIARTDLRNQYPRTRFRQRVQTLLENYDVGVTARGEDGRLIGICFGLTDSAYYLLVTDIAVDRQCTGQGIGREMMVRLHALAGGEDDICVFADFHPNSKGFYTSCGFEPCTVMCKEARIWDVFDMRDLARGDTEKS
jgi:N-acetylglutamate synthase-like GNAT family acetyltransferase